MPLKDGIYIISSTLSGNPVLDIYQAANPFNGPINGVVGLSVSLQGHVSLNIDQLTHLKYETDYK